MQGGAAAALGFAVATLICWLELVTSKYARTVFLVARSAWLYAYCLIYGAIAAALVLLLPLVGDQAQLDGLGMANPWARALAIGIAVKAFLHIRLFTVTTGPERSFPVGLESLVQLFEPWMLRSIDLDHFAESRRFLKERAAKHPNHAAVLAAALGAIPNTFSSGEQAAMRADLGKEMAPEGVLGVYLSYCGRRALDSVFPP